MIQVLGEGRVEDDSVSESRLHENNEHFLSRPEFATQLP